MQIYYCVTRHHARRTPTPILDLFINHFNKFPVKKHYDTIYRQCNYSNCGKAYKIITLRWTKHKLDPRVNVTQHIRITPIDKKKFTLRKEKKRKTVRERVVQLTINNYSLSLSFSHFLSFSLLFQLENYHFIVIKLQRNANIDLYTISYEN